MATIRIGTDKVKKIWLDSNTKVKKVYIGTQLVWSGWEEPIITGNDVRLTLAYSTTQTGTKLEIN